MEELKKLFRASTSYLGNFGWKYILAVGFALLAFWFFNKVWFYIILALLGLLFLNNPRRFIYVMVGPRSSLGFFFFLFIMTQLVFYSFYGKHFDGHSIIERNNKVIIVQKDKKLGDDKLISEITWKVTLMNTIYSSLIQGSSPLFDKILNDESNEDYIDILLLVNIQIFISWIYLGVFIASLFQKLRNE
ncbi:MAG: hypothetical protein ACOYNC_00995 [Bacteroidales bacterium]